MKKHGQIKGGSSPFKCRAYPSGSKKREKAKEAKMTEEEVAAKSRNIEVTVLQWQCFTVAVFYSGSVGQRRHFCGHSKRTEDRRTCWYRLI